MYDMVPAGCMAGNRDESAKLMKQTGGRFDRNGKGSHRIWRHPEKPNPIAIPDHGGKEINPRLVRGIKRQAGIT